MRNRYDESTKVQEKFQEDILLIKNKKNLLYHPLRFLSVMYNNNTEDLIRKMTKLLAIAYAGNLIKNKKVKASFKAVQIFLTIFVFFSELLLKIKIYTRNVISEKKSPHKIRINNAKKLLDVVDKPIEGAQIDLNKEIVAWLLDRPPTNIISIEGYYDQDTLKKLDIKNSNNDNSSTRIYIKMTLEKESLLIGIHLRQNNFENMYIGDTAILCESQNINYIREKLLKALIKDYTSSLDIRNNILKFDLFGYFTCSPRRSAATDINQYNVSECLDLIRWVLEHGKRYALTFVGRQGTGKSSILRAIEHELREYMVVHLTPSDFKSAGTVKSAFNILKMFQPLIVIIEDADACGLKEKNAVTGTYLDCIDGVNKDLNMVIISSINDSSKINITLLDRPGRSDAVIEIKPPQDKNEAYLVLKNRLKSSLEDYKEDFQIVIDNDEPILDVLDLCVKAKFTQADIANAVVEKALIDVGLNKKRDPKKKVKSLELSEYLKEAYLKHLETKKAIKEYRFIENPQDIHYANPTEDCCEEKVYVAGPTNLLTGD